MDIKITIGSEIQETISINARKSLDGNLMIFDHKDIDIVLMPGKRKVLSFAKDMFTEKVYEAQDRLFEFLRNKGVILYESVQVGNIYGSMEAHISESKDIEIDSIQSVLFSIHNFLTEERFNFERSEQYREDYDEDLLSPDSESSTELGEVPHEERQGSLIPGYIRGPYGMTSFYRY